MTSGSTRGVVFRWNSSPAKRVARVRLDSYEFKKSVSRFDPRDPYHLAIALTWRQFLATLLELYLIVNVVFAPLYCVSTPYRARSAGSPHCRFVEHGLGLAIVGLFSQARDLLLAAFAVWIGLCVYVAGLLDGNRAYASVLSGYWKFMRDGAEVAITVQPRLVISNLEAACDAARAGIGLTRALSYHVGAAVEAGTLTTVLDEFQLPPRPVSFVYTAGRFMPIKLRAFLDFAAPRLKARLA